MRPGGPSTSYRISRKCSATSKHFCRFHANRDGRIYARGIRQLVFNCFHCASIRLFGTTWKQTRRLAAPLKSMTIFKEAGAGEGIRTLDPNLGKIVRT